MSKKSYAEQGLEDIKQEATEVEAEMAEVEASSSDDEGFQQVGGLEPVAFFYRFTAPKKTPKNPFKILEVGQTIQGVYERFFTSGKFENNTYLIRIPSGELIGLPGAGSLQKAMDKLEFGSKVKITYNGMSEIKGGEWAGTNAHNFTVLGNKLKAA
jgi:hypothetical protein